MRALLLLLASACTASDPTRDELDAAATGFARRGVDYSWSRPSPTELRAHGITFASRYLSHAPSKNLSADEAAALHAAGIDIVLNWEQAAGDAKGGFVAGVANATSAVALVAQIGAPSQIPIYFSVDFGPTAADFAAIDAYFDGIASVIDRTRIGAYGGVATIGHLFDGGRIQYGWQTYAWSTSHGVTTWDPRAQVHQVKNGQSLAGGTVDLDVAIVEDFGQWRAGPTVAATTNPTWVGMSSAPTSSARRPRR